MFFVILSLEHAITRVYITSHGTSAQVVRATEHKNGAFTLTSHATFAQVVRVTEHKNGEFTFLRSVHRTHVQINFSKKS